MAKKNKKEQNACEESREVSKAKLPFDMPKILCRV